ncbi:hypothetical protein GGX14DRAFT_345745 [Mycena pura]|uniref:Uncharacterized protein n=1 Tax=Mycena pura TaxID=153505 RepID=A0AAD7E4U9_9AGAR|nr:hypothetical protein GGX14DRAFT_345745 [Mycena pura]
MPTDIEPDVVQSESATEPAADFFSNILKPGSSLQPQFLLVVDLSFAALLFILLTLAVLTRWNLHIFALMAIELALWASVKWYKSFPFSYYTLMVH